MSYDENECKQSIILLKKCFGLRRLDIRLNQDGVTYENYKTLLNHIIHTVLDTEIIKSIYFAITNPHITLAGFEAVSSGKEIFPPFGTI